MIACNSLFQVKVLLDQLQMAVPQSVPPQSSFLSSSDEGGTDVISASDFTSSVRFFEEEEEEELVSVARIRKKKVPRGPPTTEQILARTQSLVAISDEFESVTHSNRMHRTTSYPQLQPQITKRVTFRPRLSSYVNSTTSELSGVESKPFRGVCWSSSTALPIKSKEIYVNFSYFGGSKHTWRSGLGMAMKDDEDKSTSEVVGQVTDSSTTGGEDPTQNEEGTSLTASANGDILGVSDVDLDASSPNPHPAGGDSLTASTNGEIMDISAVNSEFSSEPYMEGLSASNFTPRASSRIGAKSDTILTVRSPGGGVRVGQLSSLPALSITPITDPKTSPRGTKLSPLLRQTGGHSGVRGGGKLLPYRHAKKRVSLALDELHDSSVFSSTQYGPIMSAAESTTLSGIGSEQDVTDSTSSASIDPAPALKDLPLW